MPKDLHELPKLRDSMSYIYVEHAIVEQEDLSIIIIQKDGRIPVPIASLTVIFLGPGVSITHAAVKAICDNGCMAIWCGERASRFYAMGMGETRSASNLLRQAKLCTDRDRHLDVVKRMYERRFPGINCENLSLKQIRGMEGIRVREAYRQAGKTYGIKWEGRNYKTDRWDDANTVNRALSAANACLYGLCHAAIVTLGYSPGLGFIHTGKILSFVYDVADLYKAQTTIPAAFEVAASNSENLERDVRVVSRRYFRQQNILKRMPEDLDWIFDLIIDDDDDINYEMPADLWDDEIGAVEGGVNHAREE
jgi:CRISPR-associated protein Cas1